MSDTNPQDAHDRSAANAPQPADTASQPRDDNRNVLLGGLLVATGALLLFVNLSGVGLGGLITRLWPLLIVYAGYRQTQQKPDSQQGQILMVVGGVLLLFTIGLIDWSLVGGLFPLLLIGAGAYLVLRERSSEAGETLTGDVQLQKIETADKTSQQAPTSTPKVREETRDKIDMTLLFGNEVRRISSEAFRGGEATVLFGRLELDLSGARLSGREPDLELNVVFGNLRLIVPEDWQLDIDESVVAGKLDLPNDVRSGGPRLELEATCLFSRIEIVRRHALPNG